MRFRAKNAGVLRQKTTKRRRPDLGDSISYRMTQGTQKKLTPAQVSVCPKCEIKFIQQGYPRRFCSRKCSKAAWKKAQAIFLEAGRKAVAEAAAAGLVAEWERDSKELDKLFAEWGMGGVDDPQS
jgi:hypothetical protein